MRRLKTLIAVLMLVFVSGLAAPQALAGETSTPPAPGETSTPPGETSTPPGFAASAGVLLQIHGQSWSD